MLYEDDSDIEPRKGPQATINAELTERLLSYDYVEDLTAWATVSGMENSHLTYCKSHVHLAMYSFYNSNQIYKNCIDTSLKWSVLCVALAKFI